MKYIELEGKDIQADIKLIQEKLKEDSSILFIYSGEGTLYDYIRFLNDGNRGLKNEELYVFKLCYEKKDLDVSYSALQDGKTIRSREIRSMSSLINELDGQTTCRIVVNTDERSDLAFIVQQLIFLHYPLETVDILLKEEEHDANKVNRFMQRVDSLAAKCQDAVQRLTVLREQTEQQDMDADLKLDKLDDIDSALDSCRQIQVDLGRAVAVELKLAVAASKKTGKSVIVNCFLGEEIAPTDAELATPNNCIYKRSQDGHYHLQMEGETTAQDFATCDAIHAAIDEKFRAAQNDKDRGFAIPDMHIEYATEENNFSSYTIYDTAGPDAAGTKHQDAANRAIHACDVAVFAIDYAKYLTTSEAEYLKKVKKIFAEQQKFHSLIFALNKTDVRYNDPKTPKSLISSVDFIRTRLADISKEYSDCIVFPTCSLEYFNVLEARAANVTELDAPVTDMKALKLAHRDVPALQWLHTHSENLEYYHGIQTFSADVFMQDSGMPALMNYVSYIATSKARDEIVNHITHKIDQQSKTLSTILNTVTNLEALIQADEQQIQAIKNIIESYHLAVQLFLTEWLTQDDLEALQSPSFLSDRFHGDSDAMLEYFREPIKTACNPNAVASIVSEKTRKLIWQRLSSHKTPMKEYERQRVLDNLCTASDLTDAVRAFLKHLAEEFQTSFNVEFRQIQAELKLIGNRRQELLRQETEKTKEGLKKQNIALELPEISDFEFDVPWKPINEQAINIPDVNIKHCINFESFFRKESGFKAWIVRAITLGLSKKYELSIDQKQFNDLYDNSGIGAVLQNTVCIQNRVPEQMRAILSNRLIDECVKNSIAQFKQAFRDSMLVQQDAITQFCKAIDDRDQYKADIERRLNRKQNIANIQGIIGSLMTEWDAVLGAVKGEEEDDAN